MTTLTTRVFDAPFSQSGTGFMADLAESWDALLLATPGHNPFMRFAYLAALHDSGSATAATGWSAFAITLWKQELESHTLQAATMVYVKPHSYGEYVFDWAWANAYAKHGLDYYPKAVIAVPFTPVPGPRLLAVDDAARTALAAAVLAWCQQHKLSSLHVLLGDAATEAATQANQMMPRSTVQFHWTNAGFADFDAFLASMTQEKRKKIRQERRKVADAGVTFRHARGADITEADWDFFYRCYDRTYREHGNAPYLSRDFFTRMAQNLSEHWLMFTALANGRSIASSLIAINETDTASNGIFESEKIDSKSPPTNKIAYGRYWGALERVDCLHFELCYYQPLQWCITHGYQRFEGGAQGEHKMARALLPVQTHSAHWLAHPSFADAVGDFLQREGEGIDRYMADLAGRSPLKVSLAL